MAIPHRNKLLILHTANTSWVRFPIHHPLGRKLWVLIYARYSTQEQNPRSIDDQVKFCKRFLEDLGIADAEIQVVEDREKSGELKSRPGIDQVHDGIEQKTWDLILAEDASRLYRDENFGFELVGKAYDKGIRVVCINDKIDTADEENWEDQLHEALRHHATSNKFTSRRIKRSLIALWEMGAAIGLLKPGYLRVPSKSATEREPAEGPFFDQVDLKWKPVIEDAFARIAAGESPELVAKCLTAAGLPKTSNSSLPNWTSKTVAALIRRTDYRGYQQYRVKVSKKHHASGKHVARRNTTGEVPDRDMPHLRIVSDSLWYSANAAIDARQTVRNRPHGTDHPLANIPRDSRGPLSKLFVCGICGAKMHVAAGKPRDHRYRCSRGRSRLCWNRATALRGLLHDVIRQAVVDHLPRLRDLLVAKLAEFAALADAGEQRKARIDELESKIKDHESAIDALGEAIEARQDAPQTLVERLAAREDQQAVDRANLELLKFSVALPTAKDIDRRVAEFVNAITAMDRDAGEVLAQLISPIRAIPCRQFDGSLVVLRGKFTMNIAALVPPAAVVPLANLVGKPLNEFLQTVPVVVELFERPAGPKWWSEALPLAEPSPGEHKLSLERIARKLEIRKRQAHLAVQYGRALREAGLTDPYIELSEPPQAASRWRSRQ